VALAQNDAFLLYHHFCSLHDFIYKIISTVEKYSKRLSQKKKNEKMPKPQFLHFFHWIPILPEDFPLQPAGDGGGSWTRGHFISGSCKLFIASYIANKKCLLIF
jgi:hypothetical protein